MYWRKVVCYAISACNDFNPNPLLGYKMLLVQRQENPVSAITSSSEHPNGS